MRYCPTNPNPPAFPANVRLNTGTLLNPSKRLVTLLLSRRHGRLISERVTSEIFEDRLLRLSYCGQNHQVI